MISPACARLLEKSGAETLLLTSVDALSAAGANAVADVATSVATGAAAVVATVVGAGSAAVVWAVVENCEASICGVAWATGSMAV